MPKFTVTVKYIASTVIEAENEDEATDIALEDPDVAFQLAEQLSINGYDFYVTDVEEVE